MIPRLHAPDVREGDERVALAAEEQHYARHVLRLAAGDPVHLFDGRGGEWSATVATIGRRDVIVALERPLEPVAESLVRATLAIAVLKTDYMDEAVRDAAMVGVSRIQPLLTARSAPLRPTHAPAAVERWRRIVLASVRQSGRAVVPTVSAPTAIDPWLAPVAAGEDVRLLLCEPRLAAGPVDLNALRARACTHGVVLLVGPEGGWEERESMAASRCGFVPWTVSQRTLRADAVAVAALAVLFHAWDGPGA